MKKIKCIKLNILLCAILFFKPIFSIDLAINAVEELAVELHPYLDKALIFLEDSMVYLNAMNQVQHDASRVIEQQNQSKFNNEFSKLNDCKLTENIAQAANQTIMSLCDVNQPIIEKTTCCPELPKPDSAISICPESNQKELPKILPIYNNCSDSVCSQIKQKNIESNIVSSEVPQIKYQLNNFSNFKMTSKFQHVAEDAIKENLKKQTQINIPVRFSVRFRRPIRQSYTPAELCAIEALERQRKEKEQRIRYHIQSTMELMRDYVNEGNYIALRNLYFNNSEPILKEYSDKLINRYFTHDGFVKLCRNDPLYTSLKAPIKKYIVSDQTNLKRFNSILKHRYINTFNIINRFSADTVKGNLFHEKSCVCAKKVVYNLLDSNHDSKSQIDILLKLAENQNCYAYKTFFDDTGIIKAFSVDKLNIGQDYKTLTKSLTNYRQETCKFVVDKVNKLIYLESKHTNNPFVNKAKQYLLYSFGQLNDFDSKINEVEAKIYRKYCSIIIDDLWSLKDCKLQLPDISNNPDHHLGNIQLMAQNLDSLEKNKNYLDQIRARMLIDESGIENIFKWPEGMKVSPLLKARAQKCLDTILSCEVNIKNKYGLSQALDELRKSCLSGTITDVNKHLNLCEAKLDIFKQLYHLNEITEEKKPKTNVPTKNEEIKSDDEKIKDLIPEKKTEVKTGIIKKLDKDLIFIDYKDHIFSEKHRTKGIMKLGKTEEEIYNYFIDIIINVDHKGLLKEGSNQIHTKINGYNTEIKLFIKNGEVLNIDGFAGHSNRIINNLVKF